MTMMEKQNLRDVDIQINWGIVALQFKAISLMIDKLKISKSILIKINSQIARTSAKKHEQLS